MAYCVAAQKSVTHRQPAQKLTAKLTQLVSNILNHRRRKRPNRQAKKLINEQRKIAQEKLRKMKIDVTVCPLHAER